MLNVILFDILVIYLLDVIISNVFDIASISYDISIYFYYIQYFYKSLIMCTLVQLVFFMLFQILFVYNAASSIFFLLNNLLLIHILLMIPFYHIYPILFVLLVQTVPSLLTVLRCSLIDPQQKKEKKTILLKLVYNHQKINILNILNLKMKNILKTYLNFYEG